MVLAFVLWVKKKRIASSVGAANMRWSHEKNHSTISSLSLSLLLPLQMSKNIKKKWNIDHTDPRNREPRIVCVCLPIFYYWRRRSQEKKTTHFSLFLFSHIYLITFSSILYWDFPFFVFRLLLLHSDTRNRQEIKEYNCQTASGFHSSSKLRPTTQVIDAVVYFFFLLSTPTSDTLGRKSKIPHPSRRFFFSFHFLQRNNFLRPFSGTQQQCPTTTTTTSNNRRETKARKTRPWQSWSFQTCFSVCLVLSPVSPFPARQTLYTYTHKRRRSCRFNFENPLRRVANWWPLLLLLLSYKSQFSSNWIESRERDRKFVARVSQRNEVGGSWMLAFTEKMTQSNGTHNNVRFSVHRLVSSSRLSWNLFLRF